MRSGWPSLLLISALGCSVGVLKESDEAQATAAIPCDASRPCASGMECVDKQCRVTSLTISRVLADVSLPASTSAGQYSGMSFVIPLDVPSSGRSDIVLPDLGSLSLDATFPSVTDAVPSCDFTTANADFHVEATHRWPVDGIERGVFVANTLPAKLSPIPVGVNYELYVAFKAHDPNCQLPPVLVRDVLASTNQSLTLAWPSPTAITLDVQLQTANVSTSEDPLLGWQLDVVDPVQGRLLANPVTLGNGTPDANSAVLHYRATVKYNPVASAGSSPPIGTELIRLQPPSEKSIFPTYYESISSLALFSGGPAELPVPLNGVPVPVQVSGRVESADAAQPVQTSISFSSTGFNVSNSGIIATYSTSVTTGDDGSFEVQLPAGQYHVVVVPPGDDKYAVLNDDWTIESSPSIQSGRLLQLPGYSQLKGVMDSSLVLSGSQAATITAIPTMGLVRDTSSQIVAIRNVSPGARSSSALFKPQLGATFALQVDTGDFDLSLRPPDGLPWIVSPWHNIDGVTALPEWSMPVPVPWAGKLQVPAKDAAASPNSLALPKAVIRIFAFASDAYSSEGARAVMGAPENAKALVQIAESRTQTDGSFELQLPDRFQP